MSLIREVIQRVEDVSDAYLIYTAGKEDPRRCLKKMCRTVQRLSLRGQRVDIRFTRRPDTVAPKKGEVLCTYGYAGSIWGMIQTPTEEVIIRFPKTPPPQGKKVPREQPRYCNSRNLRAASGS